MIKSRRGLLASCESSLFHELQLCYVGVSDEGWPRSKGVVVCHNFLPSVLNPHYLFISLQTVVCTQVSMFWGKCTGFVWDGFWGSYRRNPWLCWCFQGVSRHASSECCSCPLRGRRRDFISFSLVGSGEESVLKKRVLAYDPDQYTLELALSWGLIPTSCCLSFLLSLAAHPLFEAVRSTLSPCWGRVSGRVV